MMKENLFLNSLHKTNMSVYFNAYRSQLNKSPIKFPKRANISYGPPCFFLKNMVSY